MMKDWQIVGIIVTVTLAVGKFVLDRLSKDVDNLRTDIRQWTEKSDKERSDFKNEINQQLRVMDIPKEDLPTNLARWLLRVDLQFSHIWDLMHRMGQQLEEMNQRINAIEQNRKEMNTKQKFLYTGLGVLIAIILLGLGYALGKNL
jgi:hypothetical protein